MYSHSTNKEKCEFCQKFIYSHDVILFCYNENKPYHAKCLKIDRDTAFEIQQYSDWFCPNCLKNALPYVNYTSSPEPSKCFSCKKFISNKKDRVTDCLFCHNKCHYSCILKPKFCCSLCQNEADLNSKHHCP